MTAYRKETHVKLAYELEQEDFLRAIARQRNGELQKVAPGLAVVLGIVWAGLLWRLPVVGALVGGGAVSAFVLWLVWWALRSSRRVVIREGWEDRRHQRFEASDEAFAIHDRVSGKRISWDLVVHWQETETDFYVFVDGANYHLIPKRVLGGSEVETALRRVLEDRVPEGGAARLAQAKKGSWLPFVTYAGVVALLLGTAAEALGVFLFS